MYYTPFNNTHTPYANRYNMGFSSNHSMDIMKENLASILKKLADNRADWPMAKKELYKAYIDIAKRTDNQDEIIRLIIVIYTLWLLN